MVGAQVKNGPATAGHGAEAVRDAIAATITTLPQALRKSLTWDQGTEMSQHAQLRIETGLPIYFADPHSPWQRPQQREHERATPPVLPDLYGLRRRGLGVARSVPLDVGRDDSSTSCRRLAGSLWVCRPARRLSAA